MPPPGHFSGGGCTILWTAGCYLPAKISESDAKIVPASEMTLLGESILSKRHFGHLY